MFNSLKESYLRMHANAPTSDLEFPVRLSQIQEFQLFSVRFFLISVFIVCFRAIALRRVLSRIPDDMTERFFFIFKIFQKIILKNFKGVHFLKQLKKSLLQ